MQNVCVVIVAVIIGVCCGLVSTLNYENPIIHNQDNPDPGAIYVNGKYYVATTSNDGNPFKFPIHVSSNLVDWETAGYIFPNVNSIPKWAKGEYTDFWAPEIHVVDGKYVAYFAARGKDDVLCVGAAISRAGPLGPYTDRGSPLVHNASMGNIDPTFWYENTTQTPYLIWKEDGNGARPPVPTNIYIQQLSKDGLNPIGYWRSILVNDPRSWEGPLVEGPWMMKRDDTYYLFYSANGYASTYYAIGVAQSKSIFGPFIKYSENPIIRSDNHFSGPGHCSVLVSPRSNEWFFIYHSWVVNEVGGNYKRFMMMDGITWSRDNQGRLWPHLLDNRKGPSNGLQPVP